MKKLYLILILLSLSTFTFAQTINYGVKAGLNLSTLSLRSPGFPNLGENTTGWNMGVIADFGFSTFSIQPGLFYSTKGDKVVALLVNNNQQSAGVLTGINKLYYIELPVNILYKIKLIPGTNIHLGGGPYLGYGISNSLSVNGGTVSPAFSTHYKNPDYGLNFILGAELENKFIVDAGYGLGLANLSGEGTTLQNRVISFSVGYLFK